MTSSAFVRRVLPMSKGSGLGAARPRRTLTGHGSLRPVGVGGGCTPCGARELNIQPRNVIVQRFGREGHAVRMLSDFITSWLGATD